MVGHDTHAQDNHIAMTICIIDIIYPIIFLMHDYYLINLIVKGIDDSMQIVFRTFPFKIGDHKLKLLLVCLETWVTSPQPTSWRQGGVYIDCNSTPNRS